MYYILGNSLGGVGLSDMIDICYDYSTIAQLVHMSQIRSNTKITKVTPLEELCAFNSTMVESQNPIQILYPYNPNMKYHTIHGIKAKQKS